MKVILLQELKGKGGEGDVVDVAPRFCQQLPDAAGASPSWLRRATWKQLEMRRTTSPSARLLAWPMLTS